MTGLELAERVAIVTGAGRGIGAAIAARLAEEGAVVVLGYGTSRDAASDAARQIGAAGARAEAVHLDVADAAQATHAVNTVAARHGRLDIVVNNAGVMRRSPFLDIAMSDWELSVRTNLTGYFVVSQAAARIMAQRSSGSIVHVSSTNEQLATTNCTAYAASKGGVRMLTRQMALELGPLGIRTNAVAPGMVETDLNRSRLADTDFRTSALARIPMGRLVSAEQVADAVCFLVSDRAASVNGATLPVDGGKLAA